MSLSRKECEDLIKKGKSVIFGNRAIRRIEDLPSAVELAGDDLVHRQAAVKDLDEQVKRLQAELKAAQEESKAVKEAPKEVVPEPSPKEVVPEPPGKPVEK